MIELSVIVPHYSDLDRLDRCLAALAEQTLARDRYEVIVADNMSPEGIEAVRSRAAGRAAVIEATERGAGPARNAGVAASRGATLAFTDSDCIPARDWLEQGLAALATADFVGGRMQVVAERTGARTGAEAFETVFAFDNESYVRDKHFTVTANLFCPRALFDATGPFKVGLSEDLEWCLRARAAGYRIGYADAALVGHPPRADWAALRKKWRRIHAEMFELTRARPGGRLIWLARAAVLPLSIAVHAPRVLASDALADGGERRRAIATLARIRMWRFVDAGLRGLGLRSAA